MNKPTGTQIFIWATAIAVTARIVWTITHHNVPISATITITISVLYAMKASAENIARIVAEARRQGVTR
ncbi:hypothetical protein [Streptomyces violaceorubidus]|uniref:hypothetical protein n=1 Tax=Streptomyces violaceorubidus TaxID=284042 RepID=UPI0004C0FC18|nr:hypothetical protein [Streptomyces violaceorubidus]